MNELNDINGLIGSTWGHIEKAAKIKDWLEMQQAFRKMAKLQGVSEQLRSLQQQVAGLSKESFPNGHAPVTLPGPLNPVPHFDNGRRGTIRPRELRIGTHREPISINNQIPIATANWIIKQGKVLPTIRNFVQPTNSGFRSSANIRQLDDGSFIEIGDSQDTLIQKARKLLNACEFPELRIEILLEDGTLRTA